MKIKILNRPYEEVLAIPHKKHKKPLRQNIFFRTLLKVASLPDIWATHFTCNRIGMEKLGKKEPCLYLMNHSSFVDLEILSTVLYPRPFNIVATTDGFVGKNWLMRQIGCIPTKKFVTDLTLLRDIRYTLQDLGASVVMFPEASYSFDGTATPLPDSIGAFAKSLGVPVVMIRTYGAFSRDPLYNGLQRRRVRVSADMEYLLSPEQLASMSADEIGAVINKQFEFDHFRWQFENRVRISEPFRADFLDLVLYKCAACGVEGKMEGRGTKLTCHACGKTYELDEYGKLSAASGKTEFEFVTDWYAWERDEVHRELLGGTYQLDTEVDICMSVDTKAIYRVGEGRLTHTEKNFTLTGCDGKLTYTQNPIATYSLYSDFNWYEVGDVICIGNQKALYYCFPRDKNVSVAKVRLAAEELYKIVKKTNRTAAAKTES